MQADLELQLEITKTRPTSLKTLHTLSPSSTAGFPTLVTVRGPYIDKLRVIVQLMGNDVRQLIHEEYYYENAIRTRICNIAAQFSSTFNVRSRPSLLALMQWSEFARLVFTHCIGLTMPIATLTTLATFLWQTICICD